MLKPPGMTSHDVVYFIRKVLKFKKVGHTGTLDPEAAGVLPICVGKATKVVQYITDKRKRYIANIKFGMTTDTLDIYGKVINNETIEHLDFDMLNKILPTFTGRIKQIPPMYSAIKVNGKKLYEYALSNEIVDVKEREVEIFDIKIIDSVKPDEIMIDIKCSKGTYIRSLCRDIGLAMGIGACMSQLIRIESEPFRIEESLTLEEIEKMIHCGQIEKIFIPIDKLFNEYNIIEIKSTARNAVVNGNKIYKQGLKNADAFESIPIDTSVRIYNEQEFLAIANIKYDSIEQRKFIKIDSIFV